MDLQDQCFKCGNSHSGGCSTEAVYFYWIPELYEFPQEVSIVGDWSLWQKKEAMNRKTLSNGDRYFEIQLALTEGRHEYKYFIDGKWTHDRSAPRIGNSFGGWNNILPKKTYVEKHQGLPVRISTSFQLRELKLVGSWDDWQEELTMRRAFNPLRGCEENFVDIDLPANCTFEFKFKHGNQYLVDERYPTVLNPFGSLNNYIITYEQFVTTDTHLSKKKHLVLSLSLSEMRPKPQGRTFRWKTVGKGIQLPYERVEGHSMCAVGELLLIFGGKSRNEFYNSLVAVDSGFQSTHCEEVMPDGRAFHSIAVYGNKMLIYGGNNNQVLEDYHVFNVSERRWQPPVCPSRLETKLERQSCVLYESLLIFFGGYRCDRDQKCENTALSQDLRVLDLEKMIWVSEIRVVGDRPRGRFGHSACLIQASMHIFGGVYDLNQTQNLNDLWRIDLHHLGSLSWVKLEPKGKAPQPRHGHSMNVLGDLLLIFGGQGQGGKLLNDLAVYNSFQNQWIQPLIRGNPPRPRYNHASTISSGMLVVFGGKTAANAKNQTFYLLQPSDMGRTTSFFEHEHESDESND